MEPPSLPRMPRAGLGRPPYLGVFGPKTDCGHRLGPGPPSGADHPLQAAGKVVLSGGLGAPNRFLGRARRPPRDLAAPAPVLGLSQPKCPQLLPPVGSPPATPLPLPASGAQSAPHWRASRIHLSHQAPSRETPSGCHGDKRIGTPTLPPPSDHQEGATCHLVAQFPAFLCPLEAAKFTPKIVVKSICWTRLWCTAQLTVTRPSWVASEGATQESNVLLRHSLLVASSSSPLNPTGPGLATVLYLDLSPSVHTWPSTPRTHARLLAASRHPC